MEVGLIALALLSMGILLVITIVQYWVIRQLSKRVSQPRSVEFGMLHMKMSGAEWQSAIDHGAFALCISDVDTGVVLGNILVEREA